MIERSIAFGPGGALVGTVCLPSGDEVTGARVGQVLFNAGVLHRVGPRRVNVRLARNLARRGIPSLRFDLRGQGDSARPDGRLGYEAQAVADLRLAMDRLAEEAGVGRFALLGFCSGGPHAYAAALADDRVAGLFLFDAFQYPTMRTHINHYRARIRRRGFFNALFGWSARQLRNLGARLGPAARTPAASEGVSVANFPPKHDFAVQVKALHRRGVKFSFLYSTGFERALNYPEQFADSFRGLGVHEIVQSEFDPHLDHTAINTATQAGFMRRAEAFALEVDGAERAARA